MFGLSMPQWFHRDKRHEAWAAAVEKELAPLVEHDLRGIDPGVQTRVECRSALCRLEVRSERARPALAAFVKQVYEAEVRGGKAGSDTQAYLRVRRGGDIRRTRHSPACAPAEPPPSSPCAPPAPNPTPTSPSTASPATEALHLSHRGDAWGAAELARRVPSRGVGTL